MNNLKQANMYVHPNWSRVAACYLHSSYTQQPMTVYKWLFLVPLPI